MPKGFFHTITSPIGTVPSSQGRFGKNEIEIFRYRAFEDVEKNPRTVEELVINIRSFDKDGDYIVRCFQEQFEEIAKKSKVKVRTYTEEECVNGQPSCRSKVQISILLPKGEYKVPV